jgi:hypothetical protein
MVTYATDTSKWEDWQRDYRLGLLLIMPPQEVSEKTDPLRAKYDPQSHAICPTHISVSDPLRREMTPAREDEIRHILRSIKPFRLHFDKPRASAERAGITYPISPQEPIDNLKQALHAAAIFAGQVYRRRHIPAHMTLAEFISIEDSLRLCAQLQDSAPSGSFLCDRLEFIIPDDNFQFQRNGAFFLGNAQEGST